MQLLMPVARIGAGEGDRFERVEASRALPAGDIDLEGRTALLEELVASGRRSEAEVGESVARFGLRRR